MNPKALSRLTAVLLLALTLVGCEQAATTDPFVCFADLPTGPAVGSLATDVPTPAVEAHAPGTAVPGSLLVGYEAPPGALDLVAPGAGPAAWSRVERSYDLTARAVRSDFGLEVLREGAPGRPEVIRVDDPTAAAAALSADPRVRYAHPDYYLGLHTTPNDPLYGEQWNLSDFGLPEAWSRETGTNTVVVAVIDSGVATTHPDLAAKILPGCDFYDDPSTPDDERDNDPNPGRPNGGSSEHGTHVAGIVGAVGDNGTGVAGVAFGPGVRVVPIKVFDDTGVNGTVSGLIDGILWASGFHLPGVNDNPNPADVVNMSVGAGPARIPAVEDAARAAVRAGVVLFASAGNDARGDFSPGVQAPANAPDVIAVGSVDDDYTRSSFSDFSASGASVALMAPGGNGPNACAGVLSTFAVDAPLYTCLSGTSMASPFAAGVAALMLSQNPNLSPADILSRLRASAHYDAGYMRVSEYGAGVICADRALARTNDKTSLRCGQ